MYVSVQNNEVLLVGTGKTVAIDGLVFICLLSPVVSGFSVVGPAVFGLVSSFDGFVVALITEFVFGTLTEAAGKQVIVIICLSGVFPLITTVEVPIVVG